MITRIRGAASWHLALVLLLATSPGAADPDPRSGAADRTPLLTSGEAAFLRAELERVQPPERLRELARYGQTQLELGGGFYGLLPAQLACADSIPVPADAAGLEAAVAHLARQRRDNLAALASLNPDYVLDFRGRSLPDFLDEETRRLAAHPARPPGLALTLDTSAIEGFVRAMADGRVSAEEASHLASLPSNQAMLRHRRDLGYVPDPLPDTQSLARLMMIAGSPDPLDRIWCWINPQNAFDYADLVQHADGYRAFLARLDADRDRLVDAALSRIASYAPPGARLDATFALTVGWAIRGWVTPDMAGLNVEQVKDDWPFLFGTLVEETYHRLQLTLFPPPPGGGSATEFSDLVAARTGDERYDRLFEILTYTVAEGAANRVRGPYAAAELEQKVDDGAELMGRFVREVVIEGDLARADALIQEGLQGNGPLYGLGWYLAGLVADQGGTAEMGRLQQEGPVVFFARAARLALRTEGSFLAPEVIAAVDSLQILVGRP